MRNLRFLFFKIQIKKNICKSGTFREFNDEIKRGVLR